jgi:hypothetical protein
MEADSTGSEKAMKVVVLILLVALAGCKPASAPGPRGSGQGGFLLDASHWAGYSHRDGRFLIVLLWDHAELNAGGDNHTEGVFYVERAKFSDGTLLTYGVSRDDPKPQLKIDGRLYDPANGVFFVVHKDGKQFDIKQYAIDLLPLDASAPGEPRKSINRLVESLRELNGALPEPKR